MGTPKYCTGCLYSFEYSHNARGALLGCQYFLETGIRRPCPAGEGCTVKVKAKSPYHKAAQLGGIASHRSRKRRKQAGL